MICPHCANDNPEGSNYCNRCGVALIGLPNDAPEFNLFVAPRGHAGPYNFLFGSGFPTLEALQTARGFRGSSDQYDVFAASYLPSAIVHTTNYDGHVSVLTWQYVDSDGVAGPDYGPRLIPFTNLE